MAIPTGSSDGHLVTLDGVGTRDLFDQGPGKRFEQPDVHDSGHDSLELVAAEASNLPMVAHDRFQPVRDLAEKRVPDRMAERVVDVLEAVEIDHKESAALLAMRGIAERFVKRLAHHRPIGQSGQRVEAGEAADFALGLALFGEVRADSAETQEAAAFVEDRIAGQRPVNVLFACWPHDHVGEGEARRKMEAESLALPQGVGVLVSTESRSVNWRPRSSSGSHWKSSASWRDT